MLQNPLPLSSLASSDNIFHNDLPHTSQSRPIHAASVPLAISTNFATSPSSTNPSPSLPSAKLPRSPYISSRKLSSPAVQSWASDLQSAEPQTRTSSISSSTVEDVLSPGDIIGQGSLLQGEIVRRVSIGSTPPPSDQVNYEEPALEFEVVRRLGAGSYAVVYLVREVLYRPPPSEDGHVSLVGTMDFDGRSFCRPSTIYGREYAIKCLSKANLDGEALAAQMSEVTIHQSLHSHPNIVTLHRTLETASFLLLLLEYVPGEDLFYFLEQARDHYETDTPDSVDISVSTSRTPPTPSLLSTLNPAQLLSRTRLRLIASMFSQMCDAVAACHTQQVFHRDIKPENFIVTDGWVTVADGRHERKVVVKLTDFGLSTSDLDSSDMNCGSAPYMSYECRNNVAPTYRPRAADVWSLGIVLINMLYHYNPWTDTTEGEEACSSFNLFRQQPINFFMHRFTGMTRPVAEYLTHRVFCVLDGPNDDSQRATAAEFGAWARDLPMLLGDQPGVFPQARTPSLSPLHHRISSSGPVSHRPSSRTSGTPQVRTPIQSRSMSRAPSLDPTFETSYEQQVCDLSTVFDEEQDELESMHSRSTSVHKRRKRGARKGKGIAPATPKDETLAVLAVASQSLAREVSKASRESSRTTSASRVRPFEPPCMYPIPTFLLAQSPPAPSPLPIPASTPAAAPSVVKKPSKWKLSFGKSSAGRIPSLDETASTSDLSIMTGTANNVTNLLMGLNAPLPSSSTNASDSDTWSRGRRSKTSLVLPADYVDRSRSRGALSTHAPSFEANDSRSNRGMSPSSTRSGRPLASSASSTVSSNWRTSISTNSSAGASTSAFTRYSNSSVRSVSTTATSVSASSWRTGGSKSVHSTHSQQPEHHPPSLPRNIKYMTGVPWELGQLPRDMQPHVKPDQLFGAPPGRKARPRKGKDVLLDTINERPAPKPPSSARTDASTSTTDLSNEDGDGPRKVPKAQITALAKMLSALRR